MTFSSAQPSTSAARSEPVEQAPEIAFVLPAYNEERYIVATLASIHRVMTGRGSYEIVVVDNGSSDRTAILASEHGARTYVRPSGTVASLRNFGARQSAASVLVFLDADVVLTDSWGASIADVLDELARRPSLLTGSWCGIPDDPSWIERYWFAPRLTGGNSHINSGHMVVGRAFFLELGGFDADLRTGEDYEFSMRALQAGADMAEEPRLAVVHHGYPRSLSAFVKREIWHGGSDFTSMAAVLRSKIALAAIVFTALHVLLVAALVVRSAALAAVAALSILLLCVAAATRQYHAHSWRIIAGNTVIYYFYFAGRSIAFLRAAVASDAFLPRDRR